MTWLVTGALAAMYTPAWASWIRTAFPGVSLQVVVTRTAMQFFGMKALEVFCDEPVLIDAWDADPPHQVDHVNLGEGTDAFVVHPATADFLGRFAGFECNSPTLLALQGTRAPVVLGAALPPRLLDSTVWQHYTSVLSERSNVILVPPLRGGRSVLAPTVEGHPPTPFDQIFVGLMKDLGVDHV
ncbi:flavoprotein [Citricoccus sp. NPDC079358]|uniref:flavoprotein n=1 Tax=Citricoccus sp. NPDC079358 TaxID=3154653 RepID=UPI00344C6B01